MKRSKHSLSHYKLMSCNMGSLLPCGLVEVLPGDSFQHATSILLRCSPLVTPVMHPVDVRVHHWFVPHRLIWEDWEDFITGGADGNNASVFPTITLPNPTTVGSLADYLGVPNGVNAPAVSALPFRAYQLIWNEWYRDEDLETEAAISVASGADATTSTALKNCSWEKDYFTTSRPWEQKGPSITIPIGTSATVKTIASNLVTGAQAGMRLSDATTGNQPAGPFGVAVSSGLFGRSAAAGPAIADQVYPANLFADLSGASSVTINAFREAMALQTFEENRAKYGSRYTEYLRAMGVVSSDARLQRPEYLGGGRQTIQFSEVLSTADGGASLPIGSLKGHGIAGLRSNRYRRFFEEHGYVISLLSVRPKTIYADGLARTWNRRNKEDFWHRELETLGQQVVENREVRLAHATPTGTFGHQDRYDEYRRMESGIAGEFRTLLNTWHFARLFATDPALNSTFTSCVPTERTFAVNTTDVLWIMARHSLQARRMVSKTSRPGRLF